MENQAQERNQGPIVRSELEPVVGSPHHFPDAPAKLGPGEVHRPLTWTKLTEKQRRFQARTMAIRAAIVDRKGRKIGRLIEQLKAMGVHDNTLLSFDSDNGAIAEYMVRNRGHDPQAAPDSAATYMCLGPGFFSAVTTELRHLKTWGHKGASARR